MKVTSNISTSLDSFIAGPNPTLKQPLGKGGEQLHQWIFPLKSWREPHGLAGGKTTPDSKVIEESLQNTGATIMGRRMFSGGEGPWKDDPNPDGWWGDNPPFHHPVFILTHHSRPTETKQGGTTFTFVTGGIKSALKQASRAAGKKDVAIAGGANAIQQFINVGLLDELEIHLVPILLGGGVRLLDNLSPKIKLKKVRVINSVAVTHLKFRIVR